MNFEETISDNELDASHY